MAPKTTVVDPWHWLNEDGSFPEEPSLHGRALRVAQCIEAGGPLAPSTARETLIPCRRRPDGSACLGVLWVVKRPDKTIDAFCPTCRTNEFLIHNWENTDWAEGPFEPVEVNIVADDLDLRETRASPPAAEDFPLHRALTLVGSTLSPRQVRDLVSTANNPGAALQAVIASAMAPPDKHAVEQLLPVLMDVWNSTARPELGGETPETVHRRAQPAKATPKVGRNAPCPCGSGKKFKRCCGTH